jgi:putative ABC transport system permease protein
MNFILAFKNIFRNKGRSLMTFAAIASGCAAIIVAGGFIEDTLTILNEGYISQYLGHIQISRKGYMADGVAAPFDYMIPNAGPLTSLVSKTAHVQRTSPRIGFSGLLGLGESSASFIAEGYSPENEDATRMVFTSGENLNSDDRFKVILGTGLAQALNIKVGDTAVLMATSQSGAINGMDITVKGISHSVSKEFDDHFLGLTLKTAQKLLRTNDIQTLTVFLDKTSNTDIVALELKKMVSEKNLDLDVTPWYQLPGADFVVKLVQFYAKLFSVFKIIIVAVVVLSIFNTMNMSVVERVFKHYSRGKLLARPRRRLERMVQNSDHADRRRGKKSDRDQRFYKDEPFLSCFRHPFSPNSRYRRLRLRLHRDRPNKDRSPGKKSPGNDIGTDAPTGPETVFS